MSQGVVKDPVYARKLQMHDQQLARTLDTKDGELSESKAEIKAILLEKTQLEGELQLKLATLQAPNPQMAQQMALMERTKVLDTIYVKHGLKINYLMACVAKHGLDNDEDVKTLENSFRMQHTQRQQAQQK